MNHTYSMEYYENVIEGYGFRTIKQLGPSSCYVYKTIDTNNGNQIRIVKIAEERIDSWGYEHIAKENSILIEANYITGVAKRVKCIYDDQMSYAKFILLVKEFIEGKMLEKSRIENKLQKKIENIVKELHKEGIANLEICSRNIIINKSKEPYLIDLGSCMLKEDLDKYEFKEYQKEDLSDLEKMFDED